MAHFIQIFASFMTINHMLLLLKLPACFIFWYWKRALNSLLTGSSASNLAALCRRRRQGHCWEVTEISGNDSRECGWAGEGKASAMKSSCIASSETDAKYAYAAFRLHGWEMQVGISNAGEASRVYVGYKCSKKLCCPSPAELVCPVLTYQTMSWF